MDPLSDILSLLRPKSYVSAGFDAGGDWAVRFDDQQGYIKCYAITRGGCWLTVDGLADPLRLQAGESFVMPSGRSFTLASGLDLAPVAAREIFPPAREGGVARLGSGGGMFLVGSRFAVDAGRAGLLLASLPPVLHVHAPADREALRWAVERMIDELHDPRPGSQLIARHLAHMMLVQALRLCMTEGAPTCTGWFFALADPRMAAAIGLRRALPRNRGRDADGISDPLAHAAGGRPAGDHRRPGLGDRARSGLLVGQRLQHRLQAGDGPPAPGVERGHLTADQMKVARPLPVDQFSFCTSTRLMNTSWGLSPGFSARSPAMRR